MRKLAVASIMVFLGVLLSGCIESEEAPAPVLITRDASEIVLGLEDIAAIEGSTTEHGWSQTEASATIQMFHQGAQLTYGVEFFRALSLYWGWHEQYIYNEVAVFPSMELAHQVYEENESQLDANISDPHIGDESCLYKGAGQSLVFRKNNVLVKIRLTFLEDIKPYARICEDRAS